jgi:hypothetical protein
MFTGYSVGLPFHHSAFPFNRTPGKMPPSQKSWKGLVTMEHLKAEFTEMVSLVKTASLPEECQHSVVWCLGQLPGLYGKLCQTYESRYGEEIVRLEQGMLRKLVEKPALSPETRKIADALTDRLHHLHERLGLPGLEPKSQPRKPRPPAVKRKPKSMASNGKEEVLPDEAPLKQ